MATGDPTRTGEFRSAAYIALYIGWTASFAGALSWIVHRNRARAEPFLFCFAAITFILLSLLIRRVWRLSRAPRQASQSPAGKVYSFPRRFGLGTLLVVTLVFGALSAVLRWVEWPVEAALIVLAFVGIVAAMQFALDRAPREASILTGSLLGLAWFVVWILMRDPRATYFSALEKTFFAANLAISGGIVGYCTGTLVGSIFMFMAGWSAVFKRTTSDRLTDHL